MRGDNKLPAHLLTLAEAAILKVRYLFNGGHGLPTSVPYGMSCTSVNNCMEELIDVKL